MKVLFTRAKHDLATEYLFAYGQKLIDFAGEQGHTVVSLDADNATTLKFEETFESFNPDLLIGLGHGNKTVFTGQDLQPLLKVGVNDDIMSEKMAYLWACLTGLQLGPRLVENTCLAFHGYQGDFTFVYHPEYFGQGRILEDPWAKAFFDSGLATGYATLLAKTPKEVYELTIERYDYWWDWWIQQNDPMADDILTWINWDRMHYITITPDGIYKREALAVPLLNLAIPMGVAGILILLSRK